MLPHAGDHFADRSEVRHVAYFSFRGRAAGISERGGRFCRNKVRSGPFARSKTKTGRDARKEGYPEWCGGFGKRSRSGGNGNGNENEINNRLD